MDLEIIGVKKLYKQLRHISQATKMGQSFLVVRHSQPLFRIEPIQSKSLKKYSLKDFIKLQFTTEDKDLSKHIDRVLYGKAGDI